MVVVYKKFENVMKLPTAILYIKSTLLPPLVRCFYFLTNKMLLDDFLSSDAYTPVNKALAKKIWFVCAWYLWELIRQRKRFGSNEFFFSQEQMENELWISQHIQRQCVKKLIEIWYIEVEKKWLPCKYYFKINDEKILEWYDMVKNKCLKNSSTGDWKNQALVLENSKHIIINNNKKENKLLYNIDEYKFVDEFLDRSNWIVQYCFSKYPNYLETQWEAVDKLVKQWYTLETIKTVLKFIKQDQFWNKNILSVKKLLEKNKDWIQYMIVMIERIKEFKPKAIDLDALYNNW